MMLDDDQRDRPPHMSTLRDRSNFSPPPEAQQDYQADMLPPLSCPRLVDRPRELRQLLCVLLALFLLTSALAILIWLSGWVESDLEMTSVSSTRELRPVPKMLIQMVHDLSSLPVIYHGWSKEEGGGEGGGEGREPEGREPEGSHPVNTPVEQPLTLLVLVESPPQDSDARRAVRETWVKYPCVGISVSVVFTVAAKGLSSDKLLQLETESRQHKDIAVFPESSPRPESEHLLYLLGWAERTFPYQYLLRTKDRYYVRLEDIMHELRRTEPHTHLYWGYFEGNRWAQRRWRGKHAEPDWFLCSKFIRFAHSGGYVVAHALLQRLVWSADYLQLYQNEDVALATWLAPFADVEWKHDVRFDTDTGQSRGCQNSYLIFPVDSRGDMAQRHRRLMESGRVCRREHNILQPHQFDFSVLPSQCCSAS